MNHVTYLIKNVCKQCRHIGIAELSFVMMPRIFWLLSDRVWKCDKQIDGAAKMTNEINSFQLFCRHFLSPVTAHKRASRSKQ